MKQTNTLRKLKELSKHYARAREIPLHQARDFVAKELGLAHWNGLTKAYEAEWNPTQDQLEKVERLLNNSLPLAEDTGSDHPLYLEASILNMGVQEGTLNGHKYQITESCRLLHSQLMLTQQLLALAAGLLPRCSPCHRSGR